MKIIVINHNQQEFVKPMCESLAGQDITFVFDRCEPVEGVSYIHNTIGVGFQAGRMRDLGAMGVDDDILFLDGDKVPQGDIVSDIVSLKDKYDCICYGVAGELESSLCRDFMKNDSCDGLVPFQLKKDPAAFGCYSCGMWLSNDAVRKLRSLNGGRIFHPAFDGHWGDEDNFVADELCYSGFKIGYSTNVRLSGKFSDWHDHSEDFSRNFILRFELRKSMFNAKA